MQVEHVDFVSFLTQDIPRAKQFYSEVLADVAEARAELESKGVTFDGETTDTGVCHMAFFKDPDGNSLLHRRYAPGG